MLRRIPRFLQLTLIVTVVLAVSATVYQSWSSGAPGLGGYTQTPSGLLSPADRDLIVRVRLAGLWEGPTAQQAQVQASSQAVKNIAVKIANEHADLDVAVRDIANQLGVLLPSSPNAQQVGWMSTISAQTGSDYDRTFVQILREAHGNILPLIAEVRSTTRNDLVRKFAEVGYDTVTRHHQYLESTGLVNYAALRQASTPGAFSATGGPTALIVPILVFVAVALGAISLIAALRKRGAGKRPERVTVSGPRSAVGTAIPSITSVAAIEAAPRLAPPLRVGAREAMAPVMEIAEPVDLREAEYLPPVRDAGRFAPASEPRSHSHLSDSGRFPTITGPGSRRSVSDSGRYRPVGDAGGAATAVSDTGPQRPITDSGSYRTPSDSGSYRTPSDSGSYRTPSDSGSYRVRSDTGSYPTPADTGSYRTPADTGSYRTTPATPTDTGSHRGVSDTGSHRADSRSRPRHSVRR